MERDYKKDFIMGPDMIILNNDYIDDRGDIWDIYIK